MIDTAGSPASGASQAPPIAVGSVSFPGNDAACTFGFEWDFRTDTIRRDPVGAAMLELGEAGCLDTGAAFLRRVRRADRARLRAAIGSASPLTPTYRARYRVVTTTGAERVLVDHGRASFDEQGQISSVTVISADVTADFRNRVDDNRRLDLLVDVMDRLPAMVMVYDDAFVDLRVNRSMSRILGWSRFDLEEQDPLTLWWPQPGRRALARDVLAGEAAGWIDLPMMSHDGELVDVAWASAPLPGMLRVAVGIDVREQRRTERRLADLDRRFRTMAETVPDILYTADGAGRVSYLNELFYRITGMTAGSGLGYGWMQALHPRDRRAARHAWRKAAARGTHMRIRCRLRCADGAYRWWETRARPIADPAAPGAAALWFGAASDVDELVRTQQALEQADRQKDEFLAILGHELRNPMAPVRNAVDLMRSMQLSDPKLTWAVGVVDRQTRQMARLLDDMLDVSRIIRGQLRLSPRAVAVTEVIDQAVDASRQQLEARGHHFRLELPDEPLHLRADPARLAQVLTNLLNNAAKYTPEGGHVTLRVEAHPDTLELQVADDGDGIDADLRRQLFRTFTQGRRRVERTGGGSKSGLGLGLAIAAKITELHGGRIAVASPGPGQGATFSVHLPRVVAPKSEPKPVPKSVPNPALARSCQDRAPAGLPILVVDDNDDAAESLAMLLRALGHQVRICNAGAEALAAVVRERPRVVLLDLGMADMDGFETARRLRALEREQRPAAGAETALSPMLLVAVSGYGDARTRERGRQAGIDRHLTKPVSSKTLMALLGEAAKQPTGKT